MSIELVIEGSAVVVEVGTPGPQGATGAVAALIEATTPTAATSLDATDRVAVTVDTSLGSVTLDVLLDALLRYAATTGVLMFDATAEKILVRQRGGTAGTDEVQISHDGSFGLIRSMDGRLCLRPASGYGFNVDQGSNLRLTSDTSVADLFDNVGNLYLGVGSLGVVAGGHILGTDSVIFWGNGSTGKNGTANVAGLRKAASGVVSVTTGDTGLGGTLRSLPLTPAQIAADANNYAPGVARYYRLSTDASRTLTGLSVGQVDGQECRIFNAGSNDLVLANQSASSTAANRFLTHTGADLTLTANQSAGLVYDATTARWRTHP